MNNFSKVNEIRDKADIVEVISEYVKLEKQGADYIGLCPFHEDKNPSMHVSPTKKIFKCFSCQTGGNVIGFVQKIKKVSFSEALRQVGQKVGVQVSLSATDTQRINNQKYYEILEDSVSFYQFYLKNTFEGKEANKYLEGRHLDLDIIDRFKIGLSGKDSNDLFNALLEKQHMAIDIVDVGLARYNNESYYDVFRRRIMFPLTNLNGDFVGFSGRNYLPNSNDAKYVNSHETIIFKKGELLYNYFESYDEIRKANNVFLFEGFLDVIAAHRAGVLNAVASMGTALTIYQINAIKRVTNNVVLCYDGDIPGIEATRRAIKLFLQAGVSVNVICLPDNLDPDDYINKYGKDKLQKLLETSSIFSMEYLYNIAKKDLIVGDLNSIERFKNEVFSHLSAYNSNVVVEQYLRKISNDTDVSFQSLFDDFKKENRHSYVNVPVEDDYINTNDNKFINNLSNIKMQKYDRIQKELIKIAIENPNKCVEIDKRFNETYVSDDYSNLMLEIIHFSEKNDYNFNPGVLRNELNPNLINTLDAILNMDVISNLDKIEILFNEFSSYNAEKAVQNLVSKNERNIETTESLIKLKRKTIKITYNEKDD